MRGARGLGELLSASGIIVAPGAYDAVSARLVERAGFAAVYIIARTDAGWLRGAGGLDEAVDRCLAYGAAGADMVFPAGVRTPGLAEVAARLPYPLCAVDSPGSTVARDEAAGVKLVLYYSLLLFAAHRAVQETLAAFRAHGDRGALEPRLTPEAEFDEFIGFRKIQALAARHGIE